MANPLIPQGVLNRVKASIVWTDVSQLNVTAAFLGKDGISTAFEGPVTTQIGTMTGLVQSPEPYQIINVKIHLLKTQNLADRYKQQIELNSLLGDGTVRPDVSTGLSPFQIANCAIQTVDDLVFNGTADGYMAHITGIYYINSSMFD